MKSKVSVLAEGESCDNRCQARARHRFRNSRSDFLTNCFDPPLQQLHALYILRVAPCRLPYCCPNA